MFQPNRKGLSVVARQSFLSGLIAKALKQGAHAFKLRADGVGFDEVAKLARRHGLIASQNGELTMLAVVRPEGKAA